MRCVIYLRVSTREQADKGLSIPAQRLACVRHIRDRGWDLVDEYSDRGESARTADRPQLQALLARIQHDGGIDAVVVHKIDRLARNMEDHIAIRALLRRRGIALVSTTENLEETASGRLVEGIHALMAEFYSANLAAEARKGMAEKAKQGGWPHQAPIGYLNKRESIGGRRVAFIVPDPERADLVRSAFELYATGGYSVAQLTDELAERGLRSRGQRDRPEKPLVVSSVADLLANPVYTGVVEWQAVTYPGQHQPLVDEATFQRVQQLLATRAVRGTRDRRHHHELKGVLWCGVCSRRLSLTLAKGRYLYFYCLGQKNQARTGCREAYVPADLLEAAVERLYEQVQLPPDWLPRLRAALDAEITSRQDRTVRERQLVTRRMGKLEGERRKLLDAYYAGAIDLAVLRVEQQRIGSELRTAEQRLAAVDATLEQWREILETAMRFAADCGQAYRRASRETRRMFNQAVFDRIEVCDRKLASVSYQAPFDLLFNTGEFEYGELVAPTGFEPALPP
jgi:site-specific DNA recombinase